jgi:hypothetical protein
VVTEAEAQVVVVQQHLLAQVEMVFQVVAVVGITKQAELVKRVMAVQV